MNNNINNDGDIYGLLEYSQLIVGINSCALHAQSSNEREV